VKGCVKLRNIVSYIVYIYYMCVYIILRLPVGRGMRRVIIYDRLPRINIYMLTAIIVYTYVQCIHILLCIIWKFEASVCMYIYTYTTRRLQTPLDLYVCMYILYNMQRIGRSCVFSGPSSPFQKRVGVSSTMQIYPPTNYRLSSRSQINFTPHI